MAFQDFRRIGANDSKWTAQQIEFGAGCQSRVWRIYYLWPMQNALFNVKSVHGYSAEILE